MRDEIWTILEGTGDLLIDGHVRNVRRGDVAYITKGQKHALRAHGGCDLHFIEVQIGTELAETDIERFEWEW
ncbi:MAG: cupin domain-containing protein [Pelotomaculum sp.]